MNRLALTLAVVRYVPCALLSIVAVLLTWVLAPLLALAAFVTEDPHTKQGDLPRWLSWFQSHDFPLDEIWRPSRGDEPWRTDGLFLKNFDRFVGKTPADFRVSRWLRYLARVYWLWRNPAYGFRAQVLGFAQAGAVTVLNTTRGAAWDTGANSWALYVAERPAAGVLVRTAFHLRGQLFYRRGGTRYVRINVGWKLVMPDTAMVATHVNPIRRWEPAAPPPIPATDNP
jgi:hypothetical protein